MQQQTFKLLLEAILNQAIEADSAAFGNIQIADPVRSSLVLVCQRGFDSAFVTRFSEIRWDSGTVCSQAYRHGTRVFIPDVLSERACAEVWEAARQCGFRSVQSTPILSLSGSVLGALSTHFTEVRQALSTGAQVRLDSCAAAAASVIEKHRASDPLIAQATPRIRES